MMKLRTVYARADGTDLLVEWEHAEDADYLWQRESIHWPLPLAPLEVATWRFGRNAVERAFAEAGMPVPALFLSPVFSHGLLYLRMSPLPPDEQQRLVDGALRFSQRCGGPLAVWEEYSLPKIRASCQKLDTAAAGTPIAALADAYGYANFQTQVALMPAQVAAQGLTVFCNKAFGAESEAAAIELTTGSANATLDADQALWEVAQLAMNEPAVREALLAGVGSGALDAIGNLPGGVAFRAAFARYLERFGGRAQSWDLLSPTWQERPAIALGLVVQLLRSEAPAPVSALQQSARRREALVEELEQRLGSDEAARASFRELLAGAASYVAIREGRAFWQLVAYGCLRRALLRRALPLLELGLIAEAEDIFFLLPEEIEAAEEPEIGAFRERVAERRQERERWSRIEPPQTIGGAGVVQSAATPEAAADDRLLKGMPASRGTVMARARVVADLDDAERLEPGEVLVCMMTSPPWTPLFGIAGAVVTESGGPLGAFSHPAIAAREYGIPCVVGARAAMRLIPDGALVTVDGEQGTVRIEG